MHVHRIVEVEPPVEHGLEHLSTVLGSTIITTLHPTISLILIVRFFEKNETEGCQ